VCLVALLCNVHVCLVALLCNVHVCLVALLCNVHVCLVALLCNVHVCVVALLCNVHVCLVAFLCLSTALRFPKLFCSLKVFALEHFREFWGNFRRVVAKRDDRSRHVCVEKWDSHRSDFG
jgi:hypothetical protein